VKIDNLPLEPSVAITNSLQGKAGDLAPSSEIKDVAQTAVNLMFDDQIRTVLNQLTKILSQQNATLLNLPANLADEVKQLLQQPLAGEQVVAKGLSAMLQGQKTVSLSLSAFANTLNDAASIKEQFPGVLPEEWSNLIAKFEDLVSHLDPDIGKTLLALAKDLTDNPAQLTDASTVLQQAGRQLINTLAREQYTIPMQEFQANLPALLKTLVDNFQQELAQLPFPPSDQELLTASLQQICQQLMQELSQPPAQQEPAQPQSSPQFAPKGQVPPFIGLPAVIDDIIAHFESQLIKMDVTLEKDVLVTNLRQILSQLTQDLSDEDQAALLRLVDQLQDSVPESIRTAAKLNNLPELQTTWVLQKMANSRQWLELSAATLRQSGQTLRDMATIVPRQVDQSPDSWSAKSTFNLAVPLYFGEEKKAYPAYIHIFQDRDKPGTAAGFVPETWLRLCLATENVGVVDMVFHVYGSNQLNIRINFSDNSAADQFKEHIDDIRGTFDNSPLKLSDFTVNPVKTDGSP